MFKKIFVLLDKKEKIKTIIILLLVSISALVELIGVSIILPIINLTMGQGLVDDNFYCLIIKNVFRVHDEKLILLLLILATIFIYVIKNVYLAFMYSCLYRYAMNVRRKLAMQLLNAYLNRPYTFFVKRKSGDLIRSVNEDTSNVYEVIFAICSAVAQGVTAVCIASYLAVTNLVMTAIVVACLAVCAFGIIKVLRKTTGERGKKQQYYTGALIKCLQQAFEGIKEIKVLNTEKYFADKYDEVYKSYADNNRKFRVANMLPKYLIETTVIVGIMGYLAYNIAFSANYGAIVSQLAVFVTAAYKLLPSVNSMYTHINAIHFYKPSVDLIYQDVKEIENFERLEEKGEREELRFEQAIEMKDVTFCYEGTDTAIIKDANLTISKGESVAFIGPSGSGKTTTADILLGLQQATKGDITVDGVSIKQNLYAWHQKVGYIPQSIFLVDENIRKNIALGVPDKEIDDEQIWKVLEDVSLKEFVESLPEKLNTNVGERGVCLSGGQRQRIGIARAIYRNPEILFFDEATSALDNETEKEVMNAIHSLQGTKTMIMIAHRLSTIENCDVIYKVENGHVERQGDS